MFTVKKANEVIRIMGLDMDPVNSSSESGEFVDKLLDRFVEKSERLKKLEENFAFLLGILRQHGKGNALGKTMEILIAKMEKEYER